MKNLAKWIGAFTLPILTALVLSYIGLVLANLLLPWHDPSEGTDALTLLVNSFVCGLVYPFVAYSLAPKAKIGVTLLMVVLAMAALVYGILTVRSTIGNFGILRYSIMIVSMIGATVCLARRSK